MAYTVVCTVVDEDTVRYGASEFKRVSTTPARTVGEGLGDSQGFEISGIFR